MYQTMADDINNNFIIHDQAVEIFESFVYILAFRNIDFFKRKQWIFV